MIDKQLTVFEKKFNGDPKSLIKAIFVYLFARYNHEPPHSHYLINLNNSTASLELLCQLYDWPIGEVSKEYFENQELHNHLLNILVEWNLLVIKKKLIAASIGLNSELGGWLHELLELVGESDDCLYATKLREKSEIFPEHINEYQGLRTDYELFGEYLMKAGIYITPFLRQNNLELKLGKGLYGKIPFVFESSQKESFDGVKIYQISNRWGQSDLYGWVPLQPKTWQITNISVKNFLPFGVYIDSPKISIGSIARAFFFINNKKRASDLNIYRMIKAKLPNDYRALSRFLESVEIDFVIQHEIGHLKTDETLSKYCEGSFLIADTEIRMAISEFLADWYTLNVIFNSTDYNIKRVCLLLNYDDYFEGLEELVKEEFFIHSSRLTEITLRAILDNNPIKYINSFKDKLERNLSEKSQKEIEEWLNNNCKQAVEEIIDLYDNPPKWLSDKKIF